MNTAQKKHIKQINTSRLQRYQYHRVVMSCQHSTHLLRGSKEFIQLKFSNKNLDFNNPTQVFTVSLNQFDMFLNGQT